jgi:hypothetical protein
MAKDRTGVHIVGKVVEQNLGYIFREQPTSDHGIDAFIELANGDKALGKLVALQIKTGASYFKETNGENVVFRFDERHLSYWLEYSIPVILVLVNENKNLCCWQHITAQTIQRTPKGAKVLVPAGQSLEKSKAEIAKIAENNSQPGQLAHLAQAKPWMQILKSGRSLILEAEEWVNKSSGRGRLTLKSINDSGDEEIAMDWPFVMFPGQIYSELIPQLFPWATMAVDDDYYHEFEETQWNQEFGIWDNEDGRYISHLISFDEFQAELPQIRPYEVASNEVACFRLELTLNEIGKAFLVLDKYLSEGIEIESAENVRGTYAMGLKQLKRRYNLK